MPSEILIFLLDQQRYALPSSLVQELVRAVQIISIPNASEQIEGVIDYHGKIVPVLNLRQHLALAARTAQPTDHLIILRANERLFAIRIDRALDVAADSDRNDEPAVGRDANTVIHAQGGTVIVLNPVPLLAQLEDAV